MCQSCQNNRKNIKTPQKVAESHINAQKMKFSVKDFSSKCD